MLPLSFSKAICARVAAFSPSRNMPPISREFADWRAASLAWSPPSVPSRALEAPTELLKSEEMRAIFSEKEPPVAVKVAIFWAVSAEIAPNSAICAAASVPPPPFR